MSYVSFHPFLRFLRLTHDEKWVFECHPQTVDDLTYVEDSITLEDSNLGLRRRFYWKTECCFLIWNPRVLFESVLNQLMLHSKCSSSGSSSAKRCNTLSTYFDKPLVMWWKLFDSPSGRKPLRKMVYLIVDHVDLIKEWDKGAMILQFLFSLSSVLKMPQLGIILISGLPPDVYYSNMGYTDPLPVYFPEYSEEELRQIFLKNQVNKKLYSAFLE